MIALDLLVAAPAKAAIAEADNIVTEASTVSDAEMLIRKEKYTEAENLLLAMEEAHPGNSQVEFLLGMSNIGKKDYRRAIKCFQIILAREPGALRVRLELARAYYLAKDFDRSEAEFRKAVAGHLPAQGVLNVQRFLSAIAQERRWTSTFSIGIAQSTNASSGTEAATVDIYGLPFYLSPDARRKSGVGLDLAFSTEWSPPITHNVQMIVGAQAFGVGYAETRRYNDYTVYAYAGPRYFSNGWSIGVVGSEFKRWYGNRSYNSGLGWRISGGYIIKPWLIVKGGFGIQALRYPSIREQNGNLYSEDVSATVNISPQTRIEPALRALLQNAALSAYSNSLIEASMTLQHEFPHGYVATAQISRAGIEYKVALPAFGIARSDSRWFIKISAFNRGIRIFGFSPQISMSHTSYYSNINLYKYNKDEGKIAFVRSF